jgi:hypothetical protein
VAFCRQAHSLSQSIHSCRFWTCAHTTFYYYVHISFCIVCMGYRHHLFRICIWRTCFAIILPCRFISHWRHDCLHPLQKHFKETGSLVLDDTRKVSAFICDERFIFFLQIPNHTNKDYIHQAHAGKWNSQRTVGKWEALNSVRNKDNYI